MGKVKGKDYSVGQFPMTAALGQGDRRGATDGFVKIIRGLPRGEFSGPTFLGIRQRN